MFKYSGAAFVAFSAFLFLLSPPLAASVVMLNTRIIYPAEAQSQTVQLTNNDSIPYVMQMWSDINNPSSTPESADGPFVVIPALFRIEPKTGQAVRLVFTGKNLPQDRESVFYLNSVQIPPKNMASDSDNQMLVVLRNRLKIFYRPKTIVGSPEKIAEQLHFSLKQQAGKWVLTARNDSGYYASFIKATVIIGNKSVPFKADMVAPKSQANWALENNIHSPAGAQKIKFTLINDYGGHTSLEAGLN
ncbi:molecular chaperone [Serratia sp. Ag1]|uniref:fimbrial biogenesis chaperone n=2 Tax=unclassified Serratia (in: enterobacteria) TaxID=2647522 RepID=UPI00050290C7|nr:molecular chaperone [Serratia sp. Ag1]KFK95686.1 fimbrial chaperone protein [Serratia sp. Ag2]KFK95970.1 fimbrial chaperone protein [Serratia sp. Ag1]